MSKSFRIASLLALWVVSGCLVVFLMVGCASLNPTPPIEAFANKLADEAIIPGVKAGLEKGVSSMMLQAGMQGINPTYVITFEGKWVVGLEGRASVGVEGISGQLQVSTDVSKSD